MSDLTDVLDDPDLAAAGDALAVSDDVEAVDADADTLLLTAHGLSTGDGPLRLTTDDTLPAGLAIATDYYAIAASADLLKLAASLADALAGTAVAIDDEGTGTHSIASRSVTIRPYVVTRYGASTTTKGRVTRGAATKHALGMSSIQPQRGRELLVGPDGQTGDDVKLVLTRFELRPTPGSPDAVAYDGDTWEVFHVETWRAFGGTHYRAAMARQKVST